MKVRVRGRVEIRVKTAPTPVGLESGLGSSLRVRVMNGSGLSCFDHHREEAHTRSSSRSCGWDSTETQATDMVAVRS